MNKKYPLFVKLLFVNYGVVGS